MASAETSDRFVVLEAIARGGMGAVHRALDRRTGEIVALKLLVPESPEHGPRLVLEAEALAALDHPAIVRLVAHGATPEGRPFLATEWLDGEDLSARLDAGRLAPREAAALGLRVAGALAAAHAAGVVHRDVKPSNLFLRGGRTDAVTLVDFGIARVPGQRGATATGQPLGTPGYMAPEQASGAGDVDARADVFSLGAVLFECLTGRPPFSGEHALAMLAKILIADVPRVAELCPGVPPALAGLVDRMLSKDRAARPESAAVVAEALSSVIAALPAGGGEVPVSLGDAHPPGSLTGREQRLVTVLLVQPGPGDTLEIAKRLGEAVAPLGGRAARVIDGSTVVTWTGAESPPEQAARAARCALIVRRIAPDAAMAVASGLADTREPRPIGQVLDRAAALLAGRGSAPGIRLDSVAAAMLDARFQVAPGLVLVGEDDFGEGQRTLLGRPTPCVGRERELRAIRDLIDACVSEGAAGAAIVTGPMGVGKSRLRQELLATLQPPLTRAGVWLARGDCMSAGSAFSTVAAALRSTLRVRAGEPRSAAEQRLEDRVAERVPPAERARVAAFLGELMGVELPEDRCPLLGPARESRLLMAEQIRRAWCDFVAAECRAHPVLLVIEDLHWGDTPSVSLLDATLDRLRDQPFFVLALGRPEVDAMFPRIWAQRRAQTIRLEGLGRRAAEALVRHVLGASIGDAEVAQIVARASGNAFYLEELIRAAAEGRSGAMPETALAVVQARLDALPLDDRRVLRAASVFGERFWPGAVASLLGEPVAAVRSRVDDLLSRELVALRDGSRFPGEPEIAFRHALVRDGAYAGLTEVDRALAHGLAATWLERVGEDDHGVLAEHLDRAGQPERAIRHRLALASRALAGNDIQGAIANAERSLPAGAGDDLRLARAQVLTEACWFLGDLARADEHAGELLARTPAGSSPWCAAVGVRIMLALELGSEEGLAEILATFMGAPLHASVAPSPEPLAQIHCMLVFVFSLSGMRDLAAYFLRRAEEARAARDPTLQWFLHTARGLWALFFTGDFWAACVEHERALQVSEQHRFDALSHALLGWGWFALGALGRAEHHLRRAIEMSLPGRLGAQFGRTLLCTLLTQRGAHEEALAEANAAVEAVRGSALLEDIARAARSYVHQVRGDLAAAERDAVEALAGLASRPFLRTMALTQMALVRADQGRHAEVLRAAREALGDEGPCKGHPYVELRLRALVVDALLALGDAAGARDALARARDRVLAQASGIGDEAIRKGFLEGLAWNAHILALAAERL